MSDFRKTYKQVGCGQQNLLASQRALRMQDLKDLRRNRRSELFIANRDNPQGNPHNEPFKKQEAKKVDTVCTNRLQTLAKWREERNQRKLFEKLRAKPPFKVGIVHHRWYSPPFTKDEYMKSKRKPENVKSKKNKIIKFYERLLIQETERLIGLCNSLEHSKNEEFTKRDDIYHLIEDCHAHFKKLEELEANNY